MDLTGTGYEDVEWIHLAHEGVHWQVLVNLVMNLHVPQKAENFLTRCATISFSRTLLHTVSLLVSNVRVQQVGDRRCYIKKYYVIHTVQLLLLG
jgi:uncharacterized membrane protein